MHHADILEDFGDLHGDLARHVGELERQRQHHGDGADLDRAEPPQQQHQRAGAHDQHGIQDIEQRPERRHQPLGGDEQAHVALDRVADILVLVARAREQLDGEDVGIAVDDATHQRRARF